MPKAILTTLTPVHIGNGQKLLRNFDFVIEGDKVIFIDIEKVVKLIGDDSKSLAQLTNTIENKQSILKFLKEGIGIRNFQSSQIGSRFSSLKGFSQNTTSELKEQFYTAFKGPFIPGSSLKGALRSGILKFLTSEERTTEVQQMNLLSNIDWWGKPDKAFSKLEKVLFGNDANSKTTRFLTVSDIHFNNLKTEVQEMSYYNLKNELRKEWTFVKEKAQLIECIPTKSTSIFQLKINFALASTYDHKQKMNAATNSGFKMEPLRDISVFGSSISTFLSNINKSTISTLNYEYNSLEGMGIDKEYLENLDHILLTAKQCEQGEAVVRVGANSGWNFITNRWMIYDSEDVFPNNHYERMRSMVQKTDRYLSFDTFPKTRKLTQSGEPLGFVKIAIL